MVALRDLSPESPSKMAIVRLSASATMCYLDINLSVASKVRRHDLVPGPVTNINATKTHRQFDYLVSADEERGSYSPFGADHFAAAVLSDDPLARVRSAGR
jgi:hypothetical protein